MNDDQVFRLLMETNPVPDPDGLDSPLALTELERRSPTMAADQPSSGNRSRGLLIGAIAAVAVLVVGLGSWAAIADGPDTSTTAAAASTSTSSPSTTTAPTTTTPLTEAESLALATVLAYYDAINLGDFPAMLEMVTGPEAEGIGDGPLEAILAAANHRRDIIEPCRVIEVGVDHQGFPMDPDNPETAVECTVSFYDDFHGPGGIAIEPRVERFYITADAKIVDSYADIVEPDETDSSNYETYNRAFYDWLEVAYPDVYEQIKVADGESIPGWFAQDPGHMTIAVQYVEEFVAQSDVYPLETNGG